MIAMGVDPGTVLTGYAFLEERSSRVAVLEYGVVRNRSTDPLPFRLEKIHRELRTLMETYRPHALALESAFFAKFVRSAMVLGHARGAVMVAAESLGIPVAEYAPRLVKQSATGRGGASKEQVAALMKTRLQLKDLPHPADAADALAVAYCHLSQARRPGFRLPMAGLARKKAAA